MRRNFHRPSADRHSLTCNPRARAAGFTLVEILIVVVILGILAAIVIPQFASAAATSRDSAAKATLTRVRKQIEIYKTQHNNDPPTLADFANQMTLSTNAAGTTAAVGTSGFNYGPYLRDMPVNPYTSGSTIGEGAVGDTDWYYDEDTGEFRCNDTTEHREL